MQYGLLKLYFVKIQKRKFIGSSSIWLPAILLTNRLREIDILKRSQNLVLKVGIV